MGVRCGGETDQQKVIMHKGYYLIICVLKGQIGKTGWRVGGGPGGGGVGRLTRFPTPTPSVPPQLPLLRPYQIDCWPMLVPEQHDKIVELVSWRRLIKKDISATNHVTTINNQFTGPGFWKPD